MNAPVRHSGLAIEPSLAVRVAIEVRIARLRLLIVEGELAYIARLIADGRIDPYAALAELDNAMDSLLPPEARV